MLKRPRVAGGFTLVELMIALVVTSVGLLGALGLLVRATRGNADAYARSQAAVLAQSLAETMLGNRAAIAAGAFDAVSANEPGIAPVGPFACERDAEPCDARALAIADVAHWQAAIVGALPTATGAVRCALVASSRRCVITIAWREREAAADGSAARREFEQVVRP